MTSADAARAIFQHAIRAVQADRVFEQIDLHALLWHPIETYERVVVIAIGKSALPWTSVLVNWLQRRGRAPSSVLSVVPRGYRASIPVQFAPAGETEIIEGGHPRPNEGSICAARRATELVSDLGEKDLVLLAISGGGTAVCMDFQPGVPLADAQEAFDLLLRSGADIQEMNCVRRHLSSFHGGRFALHCHPASVLALVTSDVPGDDVRVIASGPVSPDGSTVEEAHEVVIRRGLEHALPQTVRRVLSGEAHGEVVPAPRVDDPRLKTVRTALVATNADACNAAAEYAKQLGYEPIVVPGHTTGSAQDAAAEFVRRAAALRATNPACLIQGGETTVEVTGSGVGGRNQEFVLAAGLEVERLARPDILILSGGTDGLDGPTTAANQGLSPEKSLRTNDSHTFLKSLGALLETGPTHVNLMDLQLAIIDPQPH